MLSPLNSGSDLAVVFAALAKPGDRPQVASLLAERFGATEALVFVQDDELHVLLPALGFSQTLPSIARWRQLAETAVKNGLASGEVVTLDGETIGACAVGSTSAIVFCGVSEIQNPEELYPFLQLLDSVYRPERKFLAQEGRLAVESTTAREVQSLATQVDLARKQLERRVQERTAELRASIRELEGFTYSVSHDLRAPLRAIVATARILIDEHAEQLSEEAIALLRKQSERAITLGNLIDDLLQLSRLSRTELTRTNISVSHVAEDLAQSLLSHHNGSNARVVVQPDMQAYCDAQLMMLALQNLIENAIKFSPQGGTISVGQEGEFFFVRDQGIGFENKYALKIFQPFERLVTASEFPGSGIGLTNVLRIIDRHGGKIWAESSPGKGTTFYFTVDPVNPALVAA
ncbi:MAG: ATP-binding protein [Fimbriimonas sp.]